LKSDSVSRGRILLVRKALLKIFYRNPDTATVGILKPPARDRVRPRRTWSDGPRTAQRRDRQTAWADPINDRGVASTRESVLNWLPQDIATAPDGLNVILAAAGAGKLLSELADENINDL
jgi:hypothetical protein